MADDKADKQVPLEENRAETENGTSEPSISKENDESPDLSSAVEKGEEDSEGHYLHTG